MRIPDLSQVDLRRVESAILDGAVEGIQTITRTINRRTPQSSSSSSDPTTTCASGDSSSNCTKTSDSGSGQTIAIVLGAVIPLSVAVLVLIYLHRRHLKKQALEDINDPHKSLDFGLDGFAPKIPRKKVPEMSLTDVDGRPLPSRKLQGLSMDIGMRSPYLLPAGLNGSHESFHSMARSQHDEHDPYRPVTMLRSDNDSIHSARRKTEKGSMYSASIDHGSTTEHAGLIANARPMSQSISPKLPDIPSPHDSMSSEEPPLPPVPAVERKALPVRKASLGEFDKPLPAPTPHDMEAFPPLEMPAPVATHLPPRTSSAANQFPPRNQSMHASAQPAFDFEVSSYDDHTPPAPISKDVHNVNEDEGDDADDPLSMFTSRFSVDASAPAVTHEHYENNLYAPRAIQAQRNSMLGLRPLPPDMPEDNPEQRANRIRSFYKEYFDDSRPNPSNAMYEDDYAGFDGAIFDPETGTYITPSRPYAQGMGRRAMTPPPRGPPRGSAGSAMGGYPHQRKYSTMSMGRPGPRGRPGTAQKKKLPPPMPLHSLPTPHALKGDIEVFNPLDFAPPSSFRQRQNGSRPDSPLGIERPYSPSVRAFTPLASSFDMLTFMPSPHELRKSSTFTALDFAPPSRIRDPNMLSAGSETGSIRSNRSGISAVQSDAIRAGAYRVSRIPKGVVTTKEDLAMQLRPKMDMISPA